jgi:hypothetical protein
LAAGTGSGCGSGGGLVCSRRFCSRRCCKAATDSFEGDQAAFGHSRPLLGGLGPPDSLGQLLLQLGHPGGQAAVCGLLLASGHSGPVGGLAFGVGGIDTLAGHHPPSLTGP